MLRALRSSWSTRTIWAFTNWECATIRVLRVVGQFLKTDYARRIRSLRRKRRNKFVACVVCARRSNDTGCCAQCAQVIYDVGCAAWNVGVRWASTTITGASGEFRLTCPRIYSSSMMSPTTTILRPEKELSSSSAGISTYVSTQAPGYGALIAIANEIQVRNCTLR